MKYIKKISFDEDLILIMTSFITKSESIPLEFIEFFPFVEKYLGKNQGLTADTFELLNSLIVFQGGLFDSHPRILEKLILLIKSSFIDYKEIDKSVYLSYNLLSILTQVNLN
jgi:hypothetical protein